MSGSTWPSLAFEERMWLPAQPYAGRSAAFERVRPYKAAVPPMIAELSVPISAAVGALAAEASAEIARFDGEVGSGLAPFGALILRSESAASSQIENLTASAKAVLMAEAGDTSRANASLIAANTTAMRAALDLADRLDAPAIIAMHEAILGTTHPTMVGTFRTEQVWIGGRSTSPHSASFVPPHHDRVSAAIEDLVAFLRRTDVAPFVLAMVAHAQFETIHPFPDGNGRTGRALIHAVLRHTAVTRTVTVPVSAGLLADTSAYFQALDAYRAGDLDRIVSIGADAAFIALHNGRLLRDELAVIYEHWQASLIGVRSDSVAWRITADLARTPIVDATAVATTYGVTASTANDGIKRLVDYGILTRANGGLRFRKWIAHDIADALDRFAERSLRRGL
jgi:Fic family protein